MLLPAGQERPWSGNYTSLAASTLKAPVEGNRSVPVEIVWSRDGSAPAYTVHFNAREQRVSPLSQISAVHISNLHSTVPVRLLFPDTGFEIELGIGLEGFYPVVTNGLEFLAYVPLAPAAGDACTIQVLNFLPPPVLNGGTANGGGGSVGVLRIDTGPGLTGGPVTDVGTVSLAVPVSVARGGTGATTQDGALDALVGASGTQTGMITRDAAGAYNLSPVPSGSGPALPLVVSQGGTGSTTGFGALDALSQAGTQTGALTRAANGNWSLSPAGTGTVTNVLPGTGLAGGGAGPTVTLSLSVPVPVNLGGTGATTAAGALASLGGAPLASPALTGNPTAPTPAPGDNDTSIATTAFVQNLISGGLGGYLPLSGGTITGSMAINGETVIGGGVDQSNYQFLVSGSTEGLRITTRSNIVLVEGVDKTGVGSYQPLGLNGSDLRFWIGGTERGYIGATGKMFVSDFESAANINVPNGFIYGKTDIHSGGTVTADNDVRVGNDIYIKGNALHIYDDGNAHLEAPHKIWLNGNGNPVEIGGVLYGQNAQFYQRVTVQDFESQGNVFVPNGYGNFKQYVKSSDNVTVDNLTGSSRVLELRTQTGLDNNTILYIGGIDQWIVGAQYAGSGNEHNYRIWDCRYNVNRMILNHQGACFNTTGSWAAISDAATKQNVEPYLRGLEAIKQLNPVSYQYKPGTPFATEDDPSKTLYGLVADEVSPHIPEVCGETTITLEGEPTTVGTIEPGMLVYSLINAVKELAAEVEALKAQLPPGIAPEPVRGRRH